MVHIFFFFCFFQSAPMTFSSPMKTQVLTAHYQDVMCLKLYIGYRSIQFLKRSINSHSADLQAHQVVLPFHSARHFLIRL